MQLLNKKIGEKIIYFLRAPDGTELSFDSDFDRGICGVRLAKENPDTGNRDEAAVTILLDGTTHHVWHMCLSLHQKQLLEYCNQQQGKPYEPDVTALVFPKKPYVERKMDEASGMLGMAVLADGVIRLTLKADVGSPSFFAREMSIDIPPAPDMGYALLYSWLGGLYDAIAIDNTERRPPH